MPSTYFWSPGDSLGRLAASVQTQPSLPKIGFGGTSFAQGLGALGSLASAIGGIWSAMEDAAFRKEQLAMEKKRIKREQRRQNQFDHDMDVAYGNQTKHPTGDQ